MQIRSRHIRLSSCIRLLAGVACTVLVAWYLLSSSGSPSMVVTPSAMCDVTHLGEPAKADPGYYIVRIVAYGDMDSDDDVPCGMLPDVRIAIIHKEQDKDVLRDWWEIVGGSELGIVHDLPPGARVPTTSGKLYDAPAQFITTGPYGTIEMPFAYGQDYALCVMSSVDDHIAVNDLIAGCIHDFPRISPRDYITVYIYFTHGHAVLEAVPEESDNRRYQQFLDGAVLTQASITVTFEATRTDDFEPTRPNADKIMLVVDDSHVNAWWTNLELGRSLVSPEVLAYEWVQVAVTDKDGLAEMALTPGDYLICALTWISRAKCTYENLTDGHHKFKVDYWAGGNAFNIKRK